MSFKLNKHKSLGLKQMSEYWQDDNGIIFCDYIDQSNMIGGGHEEGRNTLENPVRLERVKQLLPEGGNLLDFGCGNGMLVQFLRENGINAYGYDKFNPMYSELLSGFDMVTMIEVIEHLHEPFGEMDLIFNAMNSEAKIMIETSFTDWLTLSDDYINPLAGHHCVWSHEGLKQMMESKGFVVDGHFNRNVQVYKKP